LTYIEFFLYANGTPCPEEFVYEIGKKSSEHCEDPPPTTNPPPYINLTPTSSPHIVPILYSPTSRAMPTALAHKPSILEPKCLSITQYIKILQHRNGTSTPMRIKTIICKKEMYSPQTQKITHIE